MNVHVNTHPRRIISEQFTAVGCNTVETTRSLGRAITIYK